VCGSGFKSTSSCGSYQCQCWCPGQCPQQGVMLTCCRYFQGSVDVNSPLIRKTVSLIATIGVSCQKITQSSTAMAGFLIHHTYSTKRRLGCQDGRELVHCIIFLYVLLTFHRHLLTCYMLFQVDSQLIPKTASQFIQNSRNASPMLRPMTSRKALRELHHLTHTQHISAGCWSPGRCPARSWRFGARVPVWKMISELDNVAF
jgi:hypothetical protein